MTESPRVIEKVVVIEDDPDDRLIAEDRLNRSGCVGTVTAYAVPEDALVALRNALASDVNTLPDLIFLDISMPTMSAFEFLDALEPELTAAEVEIPVVLLTASEAAADQSRAATYTMVREYLVKPMANTDVVDLAQRYGACPGSGV